MRFGVCTSMENAGTLKAAGWDYLEENVQGFLRPELADGEWDGEKSAKRSALPIEAGNVLVPGRLKITGAWVQFGALRDYMVRVMERAEAVGIKTLVLGSGKAREVEEAFDMPTARRQLAEFAKMAAEAGAKRGVLVVMEPLRRKECNLVNSVAEGMEIVRAADHENFQCLVDSYHLWEENEPLENLRKAMPAIKHVHVADRQTRLAPGQTPNMSTTQGEPEYLAFFKVLKEGGYDGRISVEATWQPAIEQDAAAVLHRLKQWWANA